MNIPSKVYNLRRNLFALTTGGIAGFIPNDKSNISSPILGIIFAILATKILYGDYDIGYQWFSSQYNWEPNAARSVSDIFFLIVVGSLGAFGAFVTRYLITI